MFSRVLSKWIFRVLLISSIISLALFLYFLNYAGTELCQGLQPLDFYTFSVIKLISSIGTYLEINNKVKKASKNGFVGMAKKKRKSGNMENDRSGYNYTTRKEESVYNVQRQQADLRELSQDAPGEMGKPVVIEEQKLSPTELRKYEKGWKVHAFNQYASDKISTHRSLPDVRDPVCRTLQYENNLPDVCVIIIFHNEAWSVLFRTVYSVLNRSDPDLLKQIILVDDFSDFYVLKRPLDDVIELLQPKVSLVRAKERIGLIQARLLGFEKCTAATAIFLDSHCEATEGWLEPLLHEIARNSSTVVFPLIHTISDNTFKLDATTAKDAQAGGFDWNLMFTWHLVPEAENRRRQYMYHVPFRSPTMPGGLFAINSEYFRSLGTYDPGMLFWGGENLELSFKIWMCGGSLLVVPCSKVGHVFRQRNPVKTESKVDLIKRNLVRLAEVWMDEFKTYYYQRINNNLEDFGNVSERISLRKRLKCQNFKWYLNNIYPGMELPDESLAAGEIRNMKRNICIDAATAFMNIGKAVSAWPCHNLGGNQYWMLSKKNEIRRDNMCLDYTGGDKLKTNKCDGNDGNQSFLYREDSSLYNSRHNKCITLTNNGKDIRMEDCTGSTSQKWVMNRNPPKGPSKD